MEFSYYELKKASQNGDRIGNWNGTPVFVCSCSDLKNRGNGAYYILYDDENKIVKMYRNSDEWYVYGVVTENGAVNEYSSIRKYTVVNRAKSADTTTSSTYTPGYDVKSPVVGDVKTEIDVEGTLKKAREVTIDDLLAGFNYGASPAGMQHRP